jgi:arylsulfatase
MAWILFTTLANIGGAKVPNDRPMDSLDQSELFLGKIEKSAREGFPIFCAERLQAVKWRNWRMHFMRQDTMFDPPMKNRNLFSVPKSSSRNID